VTAYKAHIHIVHLEIPLFYEKSTVPKILKRKLDLTLRHPSSYTFYKYSSEITNTIICIYMSRPRSGVSYIDLNSNWKFDLFVRFEVFTAVTKGNAFFWDVTPCGSCRNRRFGETAPPSSQRASVASCTPILLILMVIELRPSETSVLTRSTRHNIPGEGIFHSHRC
jgi:hypothetical protein